MEENRVYVSLSGLPLSFELDWPFHTSTSGADFSVLHADIRLESSEGLHAPVAVNLSATVREVMPSVIRNELKLVETEIKYEGYLLQQQRAIERMKKAEQRTIPAWFDYRSVSGLSREMQEKLVKVRPHTLAQASNIPGVTPAAVSLVNVYIEIQGKRREQAAAV